ncbi:MAG: HAD-IC family P-type ATPase, partial [Cyanobacteria bacterium]|nr:HAD-IC family P-type ATPase [Cyanobacteriota bacterium]
MTSGIEKSSREERDENGQDRIVMLNREDSNTGTEHEKGGTGSNGDKGTSDSNSLETVSLLESISSFYQDSVSLIDDDYDIEETIEKVFYVEPIISSEDEQASIEDVEREVRLVVMHDIPGRLRVSLDDLRFAPSLSQKIIRTLSDKESITGVRANLWCANLIIEYRSGELTTEELLETIREVVVRSRRAEARADHTPAPVLNGPLAKLHGLACQAVNFVERRLPPFVQLALGVAAFASNFLSLPTAVTRVLVSASIVPIANRALQTFVVEGKASVDALDGMAAILMLSHGRLLETSFMTTLIGLGEFIRERTARRCERIVSDLLGLAGQFAWLVKGQKRICIPAGEVKVGDVVVVYAGELVPIDGIVIGGTAAIDQSKLTGESHPVEVETDSEVLASTVNLEGKIYVRCNASGALTKACRVIESKNAVPNHETRIQNYASLIADKMVVPIFVSSLICFALTRNVVRTMSMMIFDFTTGIRISAPTSILASMHRAGRHGILIKSGAALEKLASVDVIIFDKTGTLTTGEPTVTRLVVFNGYKEDRILQLASAVEQRSHHPASRAIVRFAQTRSLTIPDRVSSEYMNGRGIKAQVDDLTVLIGSKRLMVEEGVDTTRAEGTERETDVSGESLAFIAINGKLEALIGYNDQIRPETIKTIEELKKLKVKKLIMATGDHEGAAMSEI